MRSRRTRSPRPTTYVDAGVQHERTSLAWERTALAMMAVGMLIARYASTGGHLVVAGLAVGWVAIGGGVLLWAGWHYEELHGPLRQGQSPVHIGMSRFVGLATFGFVGLAMVLAVYLGLIDR